MTSVLYILTCLFDWVISFIPNERRRRPKPHKAYSDQWYEFKHFVLYPALVVEFFFCSVFMHRPLFITVYAFPPLVGILWSLGFISDEALQRCRLRLRTLFYALTRGDKLAFVFLVFGVFLFFSFFLLWWFAEVSLWFFPFIFITGFWLRLLDQLVFRLVWRRWASLRD